MTARAIEIEDLASAEFDVSAYDSADDHLRLTVLLSELARHRLAERGQTVEVEAVETCQSPGSSWHDRLAALRHLLSSVRGLRILDIDALPHRRPNPEQTWSDAGFKTERAQVFDLLLELAAPLGWEILRPFPDPEVSRRLQEQEIKVETPRKEIEDAHGLDGVPPALRPLARSLLERYEEWSPRSLAEAVEIAREEEQPLARLLISGADTHLSLEAREALMRLALCRPALSLNGSVGPFPGDDGDSLHRVPSRALCELAQVGLVSRSGDSLSVPRAVRDYFEGVAWVAPELDFEEEHRFLTRARSDGAEDRTERHFHAIEARDVDLAFETAHYYASDLRTLGIEASQRGNFSKASAIFEKLLKIDGGDAYAWEYWAYNLARNPATRKSRNGDIRKGYRIAHELEPENLLYVGRWLGFRAEQGERILDELSRLLGSLERRSAENWLARPVINGVYRSKDPNLIRDAVERFGLDRIEAWRQAGS